ncbi:MAG: hypothetical protein GY788_04715 [bacterium]|nr:hypothetical protein [bacterium]
MPRKRKNETETEAKAEANGIGHNGPPELTEDDKRALALQHKRHYQTALAKKKEADASFKNTCKRAKTEVGDDAVDLIKDMIALETEEGEAKIKATIERQKRASAYVAATLHTQFDMFEEDRMPAVDRAREEGKRDGMAGESMKPDYASGTEQYDAYTEGYQEGQKTIFAIQKKQDGAIFDADAPPPEAIGTEGPTYETAH